jgi:hypothetical protein
MIFNKCLKVFQLALMCYLFPCLLKKYIYIYIYIMLPIHNSDDVVMSRRNLKFSLMLFVKTRALQ